MDILLKSRAGRNQTVSENKARYENKKERERTIRKIQTQISRSETQISELEDKIDKKNLLISKPGPDLDFNKISIELNDLNKQLEKELKNWEELNLTLDDLKNHSN
jgi:DNA-directed RNA polymerase specialized sigma subunit